MDSYLKELLDTLNKIEIKLQVFGDTFSYDEGVDKLIDVFLQKKRTNKSIAFIGNGGSAAIAIHMTSDFLKNGKMKTISFYNPATLTCLGNDYSYDEVFSKQIDSIMREGDMLIAISSSGMSSNIVRAIECAHAKNVDVISFTGFDESNTSRVKSDISLYVPCHKYGIVESIHNLILQEIVDKIIEFG